MFGLGNILGAVVDPLTKVASEWIETGTEKAEAKAIMIKALDPNGKMRRDISRATIRLYSTYIYTMLVLLLAQSFNVGDPQQISLAIKNMVELFIPITTAFTAIVGASFGINGINSSKGI